jgi:hypothetical protein
VVFAPDRRYSTGTPHKAPSDGRRWRTSEATSRGIKDGIYAARSAEVTNDMNSGLLAVVKGMRPCARQKSFACTAFLSGFGLRLPKCLRAPGS